MICSFCAHEFDETSAQAGCSGCGKSSGCNMIKCPKCGYEMPPEPRWVKKLKSIFNKEK